MGAVLSFTQFVNNRRVNVHNAVLADFSRILKMCIYFPEWAVM